MLEGERVSVGGDTLPLPALLPLLQEARQPRRRALATSERTTVENDCEGIVERNMVAPGGLAAEQRLCHLCRSIARHDLRCRSHANPQGSSAVANSDLHPLPKVVCASPVKGGI